MGADGLDLQTLAMEEVTFLAMNGFAHIRPECEVHSFSFVEPLCLESLAHVFHTLIAACGSARPRSVFM